MNYASSFCKLWSINTYTCGGPCQALLLISHDNCSSQSNKITEHHHRDRQKLKMRCIKGLENGRHDGPLSLPQAQPLRSSHSQAAPSSTLTTSQCSAGHG